MEAARAWVFVTVLVAVAIVPGGAVATSPCAQTLTGVPVGTGTALIDVIVLNGVNHVDVPIHSCSEGRFSYGTGTSSGIGVQKFCVDGFVRFYATAGTFDNKIVVNWLPNDGSGCAATVEDPPLVTVPPLPPI